MSQRRSTLLLALVACGCAVGFAGGCGGPQEAAGGARRATPGLPVRVAPVVARDVVYRISALGALEAAEVGQITAEVAGAVTEVRFQAGDRVTPGTVLARIDPDRYRLEAVKAEATHRKAVADWQRAEADFVRREALAREELVPVEELGRSRLEAERLSAEAASAAASLEIARLAERRSEIRPARSSPAAFAADATAACPASDPGARTTNGERSSAAVTRSAVT